MANPRLHRADQGILLLACLVTILSFTGLFLDRLEFAELMAACGLPWSFFFGRVNGRANGTGGQRQ